MTGYLCSVKDFVGGFTFSQMIAIAVVVALALVLGILIGGLIFYRAGIRKGKKQGLKDAVSIALKKAEEKSAEEVKRARLEERERVAAETEERKKQIEDLKNQKG